MLFIACGDQTATAADPQSKSNSPNSSEAQRAPAANPEVDAVIRNFRGLGDLGDETPPSTPEETIRKIKIDPDLKIELVAAEPAVMQPVSLNFDSHGRLWVVQYLQYPFPAGLKVVKYDQYLRAVFDHVPKPPPHHVPGKDKITLFEDRDGDGQFETSRDVITGLNIATSVLVGHGGIWVLNPPYLLFYPDADEDGTPDGDPEVVLSGFGIEDTHAVANSLTWGPDGWIYGATGSTTTATVSSAVNKDVRFEGQAVWRYHPDSKVFEVFAEGGGNTFSLEIDGAGRTFSGTNAGNTRGMYYPQGSYGEKNFGKHGPLTNPYAYGYFKHMESKGDRDRFAQTFAIYEGASLPERYHGSVISANALHRRVWASSLHPQGSTFQTEDLPLVCQSEDRWFRPVDLKVGPDGAVYLADWYDTRLTHVDPRDTWHKTSGRIYRIQSKEPPLKFPRHLAACNAEELIELLTFPNKWQRQTAVRLLAERLKENSKSPAHQKVIRDLRERLKADDKGVCEAVWVLHGAGLLPESDLTKLLKHQQPSVRRWSVRLIGDSRTVGKECAHELVALAQHEPDVEVRSQLASTAKRLPSAIGLAVLRELIKRDEDVADPHIPLLVWWGIEAHCRTSALDDDPQIGVPLLEDSNVSPPYQQVLAMFRDPAIWDRPMVQDTIGSRLMRRFAQEAVTGKAGEEQNSELFSACDSLLKDAPQPARQLLMTGLLEALQGRPLGALPQGLRDAIAEHQKTLGEHQVILGVRLGQQGAAQESIRLIRDEQTDLTLRLALIAQAGELKLPGAVPVLLTQLRSSSSGVQIASLYALSHFPDLQIAKAICAAFQSTLSEQNGVRAHALRVLASRAAWSELLLSEIESYRIPAVGIPADVVQQMRYHPSPELQSRIEKVWGPASESLVKKQAEMQRIRELLQQSSETDQPIAEVWQKGKEVFGKHCGTCHKLFGEGGQIGPDLTGYERSNLEFLLLAIADPSAGIREEYTQFQLVTNDGRILSGLLIDRNANSIQLRDANARTHTIPLADIEILQAMQTSMMPEGLMQKLSDEEVVSLFKYLSRP